MQLIIFELHNERFGFDLTGIREITRELVITPVPNSGYYFQGVANLRGKIVPVINLRKRLRFPLNAEENHSRIIIIEEDGELIGFMVDRVIGVIREEFERILDFNENSAISERNCIKGVIKTKTGIITLLELKVLI